MRIIEKRQIRWDHTVYLLFAVFYLWLAKQIPYTHDDWDWGLPVGWEQWITASVNSRYVGNFFEVVMTRSQVLKTVIMGSGFFMIPYLLVRILTMDRKENTGKTQGICFVFCNVLLLSVSKVIWKQTYGWVAGFANFGLSLVFMLTCVYVGLRVCDRASGQSRASLFSVMLLFLVSACGQLFIENISLFMVIVSVGMCGICYGRTHRVAPELIAMTLGTFIGLGIMFSSNIYSVLFTTGEAVEGYRKLTIQWDRGIGANIVSGLRQARTLYVMLVHYSINVNIVILLLLGVLILKRRTISHAGIKIVFFSVNLLLIGFFLLDAWQPITNMLTVMVLSFLFFCSVSIETIFVFCGNKRLLSRIFAIWLSAPAVIMPLALTSELGSRLFLTPYVLLVLFSGMLFSQMLESCKTMPKQLVLWCCVVAAAVPMVFYGTIYGKIGSCKSQREAILREAVAQGETSIVLPGYPYQDYLWYPDPTAAHRWDFFKAFYGISPDVEVRVEAVIDEIT